MTPANLKPATIEIKRVLECAVILNWHDLMQKASGKVHIECSNGSNRKLEFLRIWTSTIRGNWDLVCEYWMRSRTLFPAGLTFNKGHSSLALSRMLKIIMQHQEDFGSSMAPLATALIQVDAPLPNDVVAAQRCMQAVTAAAH